MRLIRWASLPAVLALALSACAGPRAPLQIDSKGIPVDIVLGEQDRPSYPPNLNPGPVGFPGFLGPPIPRPKPGVQPPSPAPSEACPRANVFDSPLLVARLAAPEPPVEAAYSFRNEGSFQVGPGAPSAYPPITRRTVSEVRPIAGEDNFEFDVSIRLVDDTTTTTYRVLNSGTTPDRGVFIARIITERSDGTDAFVPTTPIKLLPFPGPEAGTNLEDETEALVGREYRSSGTDPITQTTMFLEARIAASKARVDACGDWVDGFEVEVLQGRIVGPTKQIDFTGRYVIAPQYGGLVVEDQIEMEGREGLEQLSSTNRARINVVPRDPAAAATAS